MKPKEHYTTERKFFRQDKAVAKGHSERLDSKKTAYLFFPQRGRPEDRLAVSNLGLFRPFDVLLVSLTCVVLL